MMKWTSRVVAISLAAALLSPAVALAGANGEVRLLAYEGYADPS